MDVPADRGSRRVPGGRPAGRWPAPSVASGPAASGDEAGGDLELLEELLEHLPTFLGVRRFPPPQVDPRDDDLPDTVEDAPQDAALPLGLGQAEPEQVAFLGIGEELGVLPDQRSWIEPGFSPLSNRSMKKSYISAGPSIIEDRP